MPKKVARLTIRVAKFNEHKTICAIARQHKFTRDFSNMIFSGVECYDEERIRVAEQDGAIVGFTCFRKRKRDSVTVLYFIAVDSAKAARGVGSRLLEELERGASNGVELKVNKANPAVEWYRKRGYGVEGEAYHGEGLVMRKGVTPKAK